MKTPYLIVALILIFLSCETKKEKIQEIKDTDVKVEKEISIKVPKNQILTKNQQIASAILAAPIEAREEAMVYGYDDKGELIIIREGNNNFICLADNPNKNGFQVVAYHSSLEPFMARGRMLNKEGKSRKEKEETRDSEAKSGKMTMPENPATLHIYFGENGFYDTESGKIENARYRYVVYIPYATQETTGLSLKPNSSNHPWLMFPGKYNAHIMISPKE